MPITVTPAFPGNLIGPGLPLLISSDFVGPMPNGSYWTLTLSQDDNANNLLYRHQQAWNGNSEYVYPYMNNQVLSPWETGYAIKDGDPIYVQVQLHEPTAQVDTGSGVGVYAPTEGLANVLAAQQAQIANLGQFTATDRAQLQTTEQNTTTMDTNWQNYTSVTLPSLQDNLNNIWSGIQATVTGAAGAVSKTLGQLFSGKTFDMLTTYNLGTACAPNMIDVDIVGASFYGIQAECTQYAGWYVFTGPGDTYTTQSLGTLEIVRGGSIIERVGLHTLTHTVYPLPGVPLITIETEEPVVPGDYHIRLWPGAETCWTLLGLELP